MCNQEPKELVRWIKSQQTRNMKFPPDPESFFLDLGLFLIYFKRIKPGVPIPLVNCEFLGLFEMDEVRMSMAVTAKFELPDSEETVVTKGYLFTDLFGDELYDSIPTKGDPMDLEVMIPEERVKLINDEELVISTVQGRYREEFLPLECLKIL